MTPRQDLSRIKRVLLARRASLRQRHERIQYDLQRRNDPLVADAPDRGICKQCGGDIEELRRALHAVTCAKCARA